MPAHAWFLTEVLKLYCLPATILLFMNFVALKVITKFCIFLFSWLLHFTFLFIFESFIDILSEIWSYLLTFYSHPSFTYPIILPYQLYVHDFFFLFWYPTKSNACCPYLHKSGAIDWSMKNWPLAITSINNN